ncbi:MAG: MBL fold metallo-hydrolase, partial [Spirochaetales bacterium]|nr:MBL fold metallo-hydrolase [Spirochaetales bacterium]
MEKTGKISLFFILILSALLLAGCASVSSGSDTGVLSMRFFSTSAKSWGDCTYIVFPNGENMLIDCGTEKAGAEILDELRSLGADHIDYLVISHYHSDHVNGLKAILPAMDIRHAFVTGYYPTDFSWVERNLELYGTEIEYVKAGDSFSVGNVLFEVLWPTAQIVSERPDQASNA